MIFLPALLLIVLAGHTQNVGVGTTNPLRKLSVTGSIMVDQNSNNAGALDSAALVFGSAGQAGISSTQNGAETNSLTFWTNNTARMHISPQGSFGMGGAPNASYRLRVNGQTLLDGNLNVINHVTNDGNMGVGGNWDPAYRLRVYNGNTRLGGDMHATGYTALGGAVDSAYRLRVYDGDTRFGGDMHATGNVGIGNLPDNNHRLRVYNGSTRLEGPVQILGHTTVPSIGATGNITSAGTITADNINATNALTIDGKGSVRSNGPSPLRIGFDAKTVNVVIPPNGGFTVTADITDFSGDNDDVRVFVSQMTFGGGNSMPADYLKITVVSVDAAADTCNLRLTNLGNINVTLVATIYLTTIAKN